MGPEEWAAGGIRVEAVPPEVLYEEAREGDQDDRDADAHPNSVQAFDGAGLLRARPDNQADRDAAVAPDPRSGLARGGERRCRGNSAPETRGIKEPLTASLLVRGQQLEHASAQVVITGAGPLQERRPFLGWEGANGLEERSGFLQELRSHQTIARSVESPRSS